MIGLSIRDVLTSETKRKLLLGIGPVALTTGFGLVNGVEILPIR